MPRTDYSRINVLEEIKKTRALTADEKLELQRAKWNSYQLAYKAKNEVHNRTRKCDQCGEEVPEYKFQNHKLTSHLETTYCSVCDINVKYFTNHCKSKKHRENLVFNKTVYINNNEDEIPQLSKTDTITEETE
jgi:uncharacterized protein YnzC (UPF0291/DUF896 family)